ncbi:MAG: hypothetical protein IT423_05890 [Pirellulaceae bacterium]|nr:hypothetical protein [Pirellulaceae bacterium]
MMSFVPSALRVRGAYDTGGWQLRGMNYNRMDEANNDSKRQGLRNVG